jgi:hypothetical protein
MNKVHMKFWSKNDPGKTPKVGETCSSERATSFIKFQASENYICSRKLNTQQRQLISLFPRQSSLENMPTTSLNSEPSKLRIFVRCTDNTVRTSISMQVVQIHMDSINVVLMPQFRCRIYLDFYAENSIVRTGYGYHLLLVFALISVPTFAWKFMPLFSGNDLLPALQSALSSANACVCVFSQLTHE